MSDWDDFLFYHYEREANDGIPIEGDPFADPDEFEEEAQTAADGLRLPASAYRYATAAEAVYAFILNYLIERRVCSDAKLLLVAPARNVISMDIIPLLEPEEVKNYEGQDRQLYELKTCLRENERGDTLPDWEGIKRVVEEFQRTH